MLFGSVAAALQGSEEGAMARAGAVLRITIHPAINEKIVSTVSVPDRGGGHGTARSGSVGAERSAVHC